jgi:hypothetical protein
MAAPTRLDSTATTFTLAWSQASDDGGCAVTGYAVFRDDGSGSAINIEANSVGDTNIRDKPALFSAVVSNFIGSDTGLSFYY